jgi:uncharacterized surface protein with fasciclin (FAS1) repeats
MRQSHIAFGAATIFLTACGGTTEERAATGGLGGAAAGAVVGGPVGAIVGGAAGAASGAVMDEGVDEKISEATASEAAGSEAAAGRATASGADVLEEIRDRNAFSTFSQAIEATDLKQTLAGDGPFTVFAPTNDAFAQLPEGAVDDLMMQENHEALETFLKHHVVQGERMASTAIPQKIDPMEGGEIRATMSDGELILNGGETDHQGARVIGYIPAGNGVIHVIDSVLMTEDARDLLDEQPRG